MGNKTKEVKERAEYKFVDHLKEYAKERVARLLENHKDSLPPELSDISDDKLIDLIADHAASILRKIEDDAIEAAVERSATLVRYYRRSLPANKQASIK